MKTVAWTTALLAVCLTFAARTAPADTELGADTRTPTREEVERYALKREFRPIGQVVTDVEKNSPAGKAGIQKADIILKLNSNEIFSRDDMNDFVRATKRERKVSALILRGEKQIELQLALAEMKAITNRFSWDFAGLAQLQSALKEAEKNGKFVLIGLSGAET